jgi:hypothetical protein
MHYFISLLWYYDDDIRWYKKIGSAWRDMSKGNIQYDRQMMDSEAIKKDADVKSMFTLKITICLTMLEDILLLRLKTAVVNAIFREKCSMVGSIRPMTCKQSSNLLGC